MCILANKTAWLLILSLVLSYTSLWAQHDVNLLADSVTFAVIGDYGDHSTHEGDVAAMVHSWHPDFIITTGDNNYLFGKKGTLKKNILNYYGDYIYNPDAPAELRTHGRADSERVNRFFPAPGNHDQYSSHDLIPYKSCFTLPGDETNYTYSWGPVQLYSIHSGIAGHTTASSPTAQWLKSELDTSKRKFKIVYFHHPPYSNGDHGSSTDMQWAFAAWGVDAVLCGHEHLYARIMDMANQNKPLYLITGNGGNRHLYGCDVHPIDSSRFEIPICDNSHWGAVKVRANPERMIFEYYRVDSPYYPTDVYAIHR